MRRKTIKLFLASSVIEFKTQRLNLSSFLSDLKNIIDEHGIDLDVFLCEHQDNCIVIGGPQAQYDNYIRQPCGVFFNIYGQNVGEYTLHELQVAIDTYYQYGSPKIYVNFDVQNELQDSACLRKLNQMIGENKFIENFDVANITMLKLQVLKAIKLSIPEIKIDLIDDQLKVFGLRILYLRNDFERDFAVENLV